MDDPSALHGRAIDAFRKQNWQQALALSLQLLPLASDPAELHSVAGLSAMELQQMPLALEHLHKAARLRPSHAAFSAQFAKALSLVNLTADSVRIADHALGSGPTDALTLDTLGVVFTRAHAHERATELYIRAVALAPDNASYHHNLAASLVFLGRTDEAIDAFERCIALEPRFWRAHLNVAQLGRQTASNNHLERLQSLLPTADVDPSARMYLHMALAKEYEDLADYSKAFEHLTSGKAAGRLTRPAKSAQRDNELFSKLMEAAPWKATTVGHPSAEPIFIVGMPRTGTTLIERILSSHPDVHAAGELLNFPDAFKRASGSLTPAMLDIDTLQRAQGIDWGRLGETYLTSTRPATGHTPRFTDKLPHNFLYIGAIANALPHAKIVCLRRNPMDTCIGNFRQLLVGMSPYLDYSYDLLDIGSYYILFDRLMAHWKRALPGRIMEVDYEALTETPEAGIRQLLDFCGLSWHGACLNFESNTAPVATPSALQVREPINRRSIGYWKHYEPQLTELRGLFERAGIAIGH